MRFSHIKQVLYCTEFRLKGCFGQLKNVQQTYSNYF